MQLSDIISDVMRKHTSPEWDVPIGKGGCPRISWYQLRNELVAALTAALAQGNGAVGVKTLPPITDRGLAGQIMDAAWPEYGGNHQEAQFWYDFGEGVEFAIKCLDASPSPAQAGAEPVAWQARQYVREHGRWSRWSTFDDKPGWGEAEDVEYRPLYASPPSAPQPSGPVEKLLNEIACWSQSEGLLWWQIKAREALSALTAGKPDGIGSPPEDRQLLDKAFLDAWEALETTNEWFAQREAGKETTNSEATMFSRVNYAASLLAAACGDNPPPPADRGGEWELSGWKLVPEKPTEVEIAAGVDFAINGIRPIGFSVREYVIGLRAAMLAASPSPEGSR